MYCKHFGFSEKPFGITPQPQFLYMTPGHREALATLLYGINERRGFIAMVGDAGTGKTILLRAAMERLDKTTCSVFIFNSEMAFEQVLLLMLDELHLLKPNENMNKLQAVKRLTKFAIKLFARGGNLVIIIDEAQNFSRQTLENFRLISNLETNQHKLIQIVLAGQLELGQKLDAYALGSFVQRISLKRYIKPMSRSDTNAYLDHHLTMANYKGPPIFNSRARQLIWQHSLGVPRKINILCDNALLIAYGMDKKKVVPAIIREAMEDLSFSPPRKKRKTRAWPLAWKNAARA